MEGGTEGRKDGLTHTETELFLHIDVLFDGALEKFTRTRKVTDDTIEQT